MKSHPLRLAIVNLSSKTFIPIAPLDNIKESGEDRSRSTIQAQFSIKASTSLCGTRSSQPDPPYKFIFFFSDGHSHLQLCDGSVYKRDRCGAYSGGSGDKYLIFNL